jgi:hypothetical protein
VPQDKQKLLGVIDKAEAGAYGSDVAKGELASIRARSIEDYLGDPYGDEIEGQSQVISRDVFDTVEWIKPALLRIFTGGDRVCKFDPVGPEDEEQAEQETDYINHLIQDKNDWFRIALEWFSDALLTKNAYAMAYWDSSVQVEKEKYTGLGDLELSMLLQDQDVEVTAHSSYPDTASLQGMGMPQAVGAAFEQPMLHDIEVKRTKKRGQVKICVLPPERCKVSEYTPSFSLKGSDYFEYWDFKTVSQIREMGLDVNPDQAGAETGRDTPEDSARDDLGEHRGESATDPTMKRMKVRMVWIRHDYNDDGMAEMLFVIVAGKQVLYVDECNSIPVASIVPTPLPHRHPGLSIRDAVTDLQRIKTVLWRQVLNNMYLANNGRYGISDKVNLDDMLTSRAGGVVRVNGVPGQEIFPFTHPFVAQHGISVMEYADQIRQSRTGASESFTGVDPNALGKSHSGVAISQLTSMAGQRVELIARIFAEGVKELFQSVHEQTIKHADTTRQEIVRLRNKWVPIDPSGWKKRDDLKISVGLGTGNKETMGANLINILGMQEKGLAIGVSTPKKIYHSLSELTKNYGFANADAFWQDPGDKPMQPPPDPAMVKVQAQVEADKARLQLDAASKQQDAAREDAKAQADAEREERKLAHEAAMKQLEAELKDRYDREQMIREEGFERWKAELDARTKIMVAEVSAKATLEGAQISAAAAGGDVAISGKPGPLAQVADKLSSAAEAMTAAANRPPTKRRITTPDGRQYIAEDLR